MPVTATIFPDPTKALDVDYLIIYACAPRQKQRRRSPHMITARRGEYIKVKPEAIPEASPDRNFNKRDNALVLFPNLYDPKVGTFHRVMFNGTIFKCLLEAEVKQAN